MGGHFTARSLTYALLGFLSVVFSHSYQPLEALGTIFFVDAKPVAKRAHYSSRFLIKSAASTTRLLSIDIAFDANDYLLLKCYQYHHFAELSFSASLNIRLIPSRISLRRRCQRRAMMFDAALPRRTGADRRAVALASLPGYFVAPGPLRACDAWHIDATINSLTTAH